jgi:hypothetical protein
MACGTCGAKKRNNPFDKKGNSLENYAFLNPNQLALRKAQEEKERQESEDK